MLASLLPVPPSLLTPPQLCGERLPSPEQALPVTITHQKPWSRALTDASACGHARCCRKWSLSAAAGPSACDLGGPVTPGPLPPNLQQGTPEGGARG